MMRLIVGLCGLFCLVGCGGGGGASARVDDIGGTAPPPTPPAVPTPVIDPNISTDTALANVTSDKLSNLRYLAVTNDRDSRDGNAGQLDHDQREITGGLLAGTVDDAFLRITLDGSIPITLTDPIGADFTRRFRTENADALFGVAGVPTAVADIPSSGRADYAGIVRMDLNSARAGPFTLEGDADIAVNWSGGVTTRFSNLDGTRAGGVAVQNVGTIELSDARRSGTGFSGGTLATNLAADGEDIDFSGSADIDHHGQFFGPGASEVGGTVAITDDVGGNSLSAVYIAN